MQVRSFLNLPDCNSQQISISLIKQPNFVRSFLVHSRPTNNVLTDEHAVRTAAQPHYINCQEGPKNHSHGSRTNTVVVGMSILHLQLHQVSYCVLKAVEKN